MTSMRYSCWHKQILKCIKSNLIRIFLLNYNLEMKKSADELLKERYYAYFRQTHTLRQYVVFPVMTLVVSFGMWRERSWLMVSLFLIVITRVMMTRQKQVIVSCLVSVIVSACFFMAFARTPRPAPSAERTFTTVIQPQTIVIKGDYFQFTGVTPGQSGKSRYRYKLTSEAEKNVYQQLARQASVKVTGKFSLPKTARNLNGFDNRRYLSEQGIDYLVDVKSLEIFGVKASFSPLVKLREWKSWLLHYVNRTFGYYTRLYVKSLLLGDKGEEFANERESFEKLGILYLFSISGMHVTFFASLWHKLLRRTPLALEWIEWLEYGYLFALYFLFGEGIAVLRALLAYVLLTRNRRYRLGFSSLDTWALSLLGCFLLKSEAIFSIGSCYSFFLTFCLIYLRPSLARYASGWRYNFLISVGLSLLAFPLNSYFFYENRLLAFVFSFVLLPLICRVLLPLICFSLVTPFLAQLVEMLFKGCHFLFVLLGELPIAHVITGKIPLIGLMAMLVLLGWSLIKLESSWRQSLIGVCLMASLTCSYKYLNYQGVVAFVDVGQGDCLVIQEPFHGTVTIVDVGGRMLYEKEAWQQSLNVPGVTYTLLPFLKSLGITRVDALACTHSDADHVGDLVAVLDSVTVERLVFPTGLEQNESFARKIQPYAKQIAFQQVLAGTKFKLGDLVFDVLSPTKVEDDGGNNDSLVLSTQIGQANFLLTGDMEEAGELSLLKRYPNLSIDVLKVGHHGSKTSTTDAFIAQIQPKLAIISCGENNRFGHPRPEVLETLAKYQVNVCRTDLKGMIYFEWSGLTGKIKGPLTLVADSR
ncbi:DNA internalization-related competence protein ComEC/Rec2 [Vagococcus zengguangii]|nr:DNA internalization-related competence protein ComEC/Rec2 [Vagococcus zengguangii]